MHMKRLRQLLRFLTKPRSSDADRQRRERVQNILLLSAALMATAALLSYMTVYIQESLFGNSQFDWTPLLALSVTLFFWLLLLLSRALAPRVAAHIIIWLYFLLALYTTVSWGLELVYSIILYILTIVLAGILIHARMALFMLLVIGVALSAIIMSLNAGYHMPDYSWLDEQYRQRDVIVITLLMGVIALVSWLSNREMRMALDRAITSEQALTEERNLLEVRVEERTRQLKESQLERISQLRQFANVGRLTSGIIHDLRQPMSSLSLSMGRLYKKTNDSHNQELQDMRESIERSMDSLQKMEEYLQGASRHIKSEGHSEQFGMAKHIDQAIQLLQFKAKTAGVRVEKHIDSDYNIIGDPVKFFQVLTNLLSNAIDAFHDTGIQDPSVSISLRADESDGVLSVQDNGPGIDPDTRASIFDPFFTTKESGTGLGLVVVKDVVEEQFHGSIVCESVIGSGTTFTIHIPLSKEA